MDIKTLQSINDLSSLSISEVWNQKNTFIFLIDPEIYEQLKSLDLNDVEKADLNKLKTNYFRKRFIVSRLSLKYIL